MIALLLSCPSLSINIAGNVGVSENMQYNRNHYVDIVCDHCGKLYVMHVNKDDLNDFFRNEKMCIEAMPYLEPGERELLLSKTCGDCFDKLFGTGEDNET